MKQINVKVFSPNTIITFTSAAKTWGELELQINNNGIPTKNMTCICGNNKMKFELRSTKLPVFEGTYDLTIMVIQTKSNKGNIREDVKKIFNRNEVAKRHFGNYTIKTNSELKVLKKGWKLVKIEEKIKNLEAKLEILRYKVIKFEVKNEKFNS